MSADALPPGAGIPGRLAQLILESATDYAVFTTDASGTVTSWSAGAEHVLGWGAAEAVGQPTAMIFTPEDRAGGTPEREMRSALDQGQAADERWHLKRDGSRFWASGQLLPLRESGALVGFAKILRDRTRERLTEERLRAAETDAHRANALVAAEGERLRALFHQAPGFMCVLRGRSHVFEFTNAAYQQLVGHRDVVGRSVAEALPEVAGQGFLELLDRVYVTGEAFTGRRMRFDVQRSPGAPLESRFVDLVYQPITDEAGQVSGIFAEGSDVTEAYRAQEALQASEEFSRSVLASSSDCIKVLGLDGSLQFMSEGGLHVMEIDDFSAVAGCPWPDFREGAGHDAARAAIEAAKTGGRSRFQGPAPTAKGTPRWWDVAVTPILGPDGRPDRLLSVSRDITELHRAQQAMAQSEAQLRQLNATLEERVEERTRELVQSEARFQAYFEASPEHLFLVRAMPDGRLMFEDLNPAAQALYGLPRARFVGRTLAEVLSPARAAAVEQHLRECLRLDRPVRYEAETPVAAGRMVVLNVVAAPLGLSNGGGGLVLFCGRDLTEQRQAEAQLRQAQKMEAVGQLTGGIAHDFNNMLQGIAGSLDMMRRRVEQGRAAEIGRYMDPALKTVERAAALTHRLLAFARRQSLDPKSVEPDELVRGMAELIRRTVGPAMEVRLRLRDSIWSVLCDPNQLENVLLNLAINARDAMREGDTLTIATADLHLGRADVAGQDGAAPGDHVEIAVSDTGAGMDEATRARAFEPFFTTKPTGQGTGLGLSQVYGFMRQSGGFVRLDSTPGQGTTVRLYLPRHADVRVAAPQEEGTGPEPAGAGQAVLLVEDEKAVRALAAERLREFGYEVLEAADGSAALRLLATQARVDLLVTDVGLPGGLNGRQVAEAARERRPGLPVLFITGYAGTALDGPLAPGMEVIGKPFALDALAAKARAMLEAAPAA